MITFNEEAMHGTFVFYDHIGTLKLNIFGLTEDQYTEEQSYIGDKTKSFPRSL